MRESLRNSTETRVRRISLLGLAISLTALPAFAAVESVPASVRACGAETDPGRRLACYDREIARFAVPSSSATAAATSSGHDARPTSAPTVAAPPAAADRPRPTDEPKPTQQDTAAQELRHLSARVVSIGGSPDEQVLHLDNGQVWEQIQPATTELNLHKGDTVKIDKQLGDYWASGRYGGAMKVRQKN